MSHDMQNAITRVTVGTSATSSTVLPSPRNTRSQSTLSKAMKDMRPSISQEGGATYGVRAT